MTKNIFTPTSILLPKGVSMEKWSVVACDQFSSEHDYWERVKANVGDSPSTFRLIIPEAYLEEIDEDMEKEKVAETMKQYLSSDLFFEIRDSFVYVERTQPDGRIRRGIVGAIELDSYDFTTSDTPIRASEGTVLDRLPPRIAVRKSAALELPHIMTLIDDCDDTVIGPLAKKAADFPVLYDFDLMEGGGHIKGMQVTGSDAHDVMAAITKLGDAGEILMAIGDGNHSLAAAKVYWDELKVSLTDEQRQNHPAGRALVEINNVYDDAIDFEPIHRVLFNVDPGQFIEEFVSAMPKDCEAEYQIVWASHGEAGRISVGADCIGSMIDAVGKFLDEYTKKNNARIDYIHGDDVVKKLSTPEDCLGLMFPAMEKSDFFKTVQERGVFPKKSFSIGHARDKRYYIECRGIKQG